MPAAIFIVIVIGGIILALMSAFFKKEAACELEFPVYEKKVFLLSKAEYSFYQVLRHVLGDKYTIFPKIRLADIVYIKKGTQNRQAAFNRIQSKHIDFLVCDNTSKIILAIELDDRWHSNSKAKERDEFKNELLDAVGIRLERVKVQNSYNTDQIREMLAGKRT